jgi:eukaryotic-like serine/threonine-protein kinase
MPKRTPEDADEIAPGTVVDGRYKVVRPIGQGGNGTVYEVEHARTGAKLALKVLLDEASFGRLEGEARAASLMKNGHTARIIDMDTGGPTGAYMVMELLEGQNLRGLLDDAGQLPLELTVNIAMQVCECLHEAHGLGIIHRDLKPENMFLCASNWPGQYDVKVLDFGVMKIAEAGGAIPKRSLTRTGSTVGTPYYMSLEQLRNASAVDARADVYSLGVVLYECLSGKKPYQADTIGDLVYALCSGPPPQLARIRPDLPAEVSEVVMRTLSANRDDRPATMLDLASTLLPHANAPFALWIKVDGKQPALTRAAGAPQAPSPERRAPATVTEPPPAAPPEARDGGRRDTPTEMYVKGVHGPAGVDDDASTPEGGRDTPTRAIDVATLEARRSALGNVALPQDDVPDLPTFDLHAGAHRPARDQVPPALATMKLTAPFPNGEFPPGVASGPLVGAPAPPKPGWQLALDRALIQVGGFADRQIRAFRGAPQNTKIIVGIVVVTVTLLLLGVVLFRLTH